MTTLPLCTLSVELTFAGSPSLSDLNQASTQDCGSKGIQMRRGETISRSSESTTITLRCFQPASGTGASR
ncbi:hypothetical protein PBY51_010189 [Eleginops maclovinus]|uniref:Uncharacterized protein n=1 Tax=Eleginops maclovinus TaxID=56733 RepID=A0AAN7XB41_ELEMC|nr:hypothetical protein PBY51_010189 [Eleginops maclovinus]